MRLTYKRQQLILLLLVAYCLFMAAYEFSNDFQETSDKYSSIWNK